MQGLTAGIRHPDADFGDETAFDHKVRLLSTGFGTAEVYHAGGNVVKENEVESGT